MAKIQQVKKVSGQVRRGRSLSFSPRVVRVNTRAQPSNLVESADPEASDEREFDLGFVLGKFQGSLQSFLKQFQSSFSLQLKGLSESLRSPQMAVSPQDLGVSIDWGERISKGVEEANLSLMEILDVLKGQQSQGVSRSNVSLSGESFSDSKQEEKEKKRAVVISKTIQGVLESMGLGKVAKEFGLTKKIVERLSSKKKVSGKVLSETVEDLTKEVIELSRESKSGRKLTEKEIETLEKFVSTVSEERESMALKTQDTNQRFSENLAEARDKKEQSAERKGKITGGVLEAFGLGGLEEFIDIPGSVKKRGVKGTLGRAKRFVTKSVPRFTRSVARGVGSGS